MIFSRLGLCFLSHLTLGLVAERPLCAYKPRALIPRSHYVVQMEEENPSLPGEDLLKWRL